MKRYRVKLIFRYTDTVEVEAENEDEAEQKALQECSETFDCHEDTEIREI